VHDFGEFNLVGLQACITLPKTWKEKVPESKRMFTIESGPGADPNPSRGRKVSGRWADGTPDVRDSHDFDYVIKDGRKVYKREPEQTVIDVACIAEPSKPEPSKGTPKASTPSPPPPKKDIPAKPREARKAESRNRPVKATENKEW